MTNANLLSALKIKMRDTTDSVWTEPEKQEAIDESLREIGVIVEDSSLTAVTTTQDYTIPSTITRVSKVYITQSSNKIEVSGWEQIGATLRFPGGPPLNGTITLTGFDTLTSSDNIPEDSVNFALYSSGYKLWEMLANKYATGLLMSDITLAEIETGMGDFQRKAEQARARIRKYGYSV